MGVVHIGLAATRSGADPLQAPGRALDVLQGFQHGLGVFPRGDAEARRHQGVGGLIAADQGQAYIKRAAVGRDRQALSLRRQAAPDQGQGLPALAHRE